MSRRARRHEEHVNHEGWAIPYGDLITLLLAFFVVMYAISSVNAGKYRVLSDSLYAAFRGTPRTIEPVQAESAVGAGATLTQPLLNGLPRATLAPVPTRPSSPPPAPPAPAVPEQVSARSAALAEGSGKLAHIAD